MRCETKTLTWHRGYLLYALCVISVLMFSIDSSIVSVALPTMMAELDTTLPLDDVRREPAGLGARARGGALLIEKRRHHRPGCRDGVTVEKRDQRGDDRTLSLFCQTQAPGRDGVPDPPGEFQVDGYGELARHALRMLRERRLGDRQCDGDRAQEPVVPPRRIELLFSG